MRGSRSGRLAKVIGCLIAVVDTVAPAEAHLVNSGLGPIYDGVTHALLSPEDLIPILAIALLAGLNGPAAGRFTLFTVTAAWLVAGIAGALLVKPLPMVAIAGTAVVVGTLSAADYRLPPATIVALATTVGGLHGFLNGASLGQIGPVTVGTLVGIVCAVFVLVSTISALVISTAARWVRVGYRVAGSWIAAIGILMAGWSFRGIG